jgi:hypothetical protein
MNKIVLNFVVAFAFLYVADIQAQKVKISYPGSLPGDWFYYGNEGAPYSFSVMNVNRENIGPEPSSSDDLAIQDYKTQVFFSFLQDGGAWFSAGGTTYTDFVRAYVMEREYSEYLEYYRVNHKSQADYIKDKYGDKLPSGIEKVSLGRHQAYSYKKRGENEGTDYYFILFDNDEQIGVSTTLRISAIPEKRNYTFDTYYSSAVNIINNLDFQKEDGETDNKKEIIVTGLLKAYQQINPPARGVEALKDMSIKKWFQRGNAISYLNLSLQVDDPKALAEVVVEFEIDEPCKITGPARRIRANEKKEAETTFSYNQSAAVGQGGVVFARAIFPEKIFIKEDGTYEASETMKKVTVQINPICSEFMLMNQYYKEYLISDVTITEDKMERDFVGVIKGYQSDSGNEITATNYMQAGLLYFLGNHAGETCFGTLQYYTENEIQLSKSILNSGKKLSPADVFKKALEINKGDVTKALLACHNVIRSAARGAEDFSRELSPEDKALLQRPNYKGLDAATTRKKKELEEIAGMFRNSAIYENLTPFRPGGDNMGAWYHFFATSLLSFNNQSMPSLDGSSDMSGALDLMVWAEENIISGDIYSDPNEFCVDHMGLNLGEAIAKQFFPALFSAQRARNFVDYMKRRSNADKKGEMPVGVSVNSPVSIKVTDAKTGEFFSYDQKTGKYIGRLPVAPLFYPEENSNYLRYIMLLPAGQYNIQCDAIDKGKFSFYTFDFNNNTGAKYENIEVMTGNHFEISISPENTTSPLQVDGGKTISPEVVVYDDNRVQEIREDALKVVVDEFNKKDQEQNQNQDEITPDNDSLPVVKSAYINIATILGALFFVFGLILLLVNKKVLGVLILLAGVALAGYGLLFYQPEKYRILQSIDNQIYRLISKYQTPKDEALIKESPETTNENIGTQDIENIKEENPHNVETQSQPEDELIKAEREYKEAFSKYTKLGTEGGEGNITDALTDYKNKYEKYMELLKKRKE